MTKTATARAKKTTGKTNGRVEMRKTELIPIASIALSQLEPQKRRREYFKPEEITELADSIKQHGLINPITVRPNGKGYELVAGERRLLATKKAGYDTIEAIVRNLTDQATIEIQLVENLKRLDLPPLDEALSYKYLIEHAEIEEGGVKRPYTVADIASKFARTEELILRRLKLTDLIDEGKKDLAEGYLPLGHAELLARFPVDTQEKLLGEHVYRYGKGGKRTDGYVRLASLQDSIESNNVSLSLAGAKFDREDPTLRADGLVCSACPKRTGFMPKLFSDTKLGAKDSCLDIACWNGKLRAMLTKKREKLAGELPNPKALPLKDLVLLVPMVKKNGNDYYGHRDMSLGKGVYLANNWSKETYKEAKKKDECPHVEKALRIGGTGLGAVTMVCRSKTCKVHKLKKESSNSYSYDYEAHRLKRSEHELKAKIVDEVRIPLINRKVEQYSDKKWIFDDLAEFRALLVALMDNDHCDVLSDFPKVVPAELSKSRWQRKDVAAVIQKVDATTLSRLFAVLAFGNLGESDYHDMGDQTPIRKLAEEFGENYDLLAAEARVKLTPTEGGHRATAQAYLDDLKAGKQVKPPTVYWPRKPKPEEKKTAKTKGKAKAKAS